MLPNILLIGYGFVGQNLYKKLKTTNFDVKVLSPHVEENIEKGFFRAKIQDIPFIKSLNLESTVLIHTAHIGYPLHENDTLIREVEENLTPLLLLLEHIKKLKNCRLIYLSSGGAIYGKPQNSLVEEKHELNPISFYGMCKKYMEEAIRLYHQQYNIEYDIIRPSNIYSLDWKTGKKQGLISALVSAVNENNPFHLWGNGQNKKDYIHIDDVNNALIKIIQKEASNTEFNLSANKGYSINEMIKIIENKYDTKIEVIHCQTKEQDVESIVLDNTKLKNHIDWQVQPTIL